MSPLGPTAIAVAALAMIEACNSRPSCAASGDDGGATGGQISIGPTPLPGAASIDRVSIFGTGSRIVGTVAIDRDVGSVEAEGTSANAYRYDVSAFENGPEPSTKRC